MKHELYENLRITGMQVAFVETNSFASTFLHEMNILEPEIQRRFQNVPLLLVSIWSHPLLAQNREFSCNTGYRLHVRMRWFSFFEYSNIVLLFCHFYERKCDK